MEDTVRIVGIPEKAVSLEFHRVEFPEHPGKDIFFRHNRYNAGLHIFHNINPLVFVVEHEKIEPDELVLMYLLNGDDIFKLAFIVSEYHASHADCGDSLKDEFSFLWIFDPHDTDTTQSFREGIDCLDVFLRGSLYFSEGSLLNGVFHNKDIFLFDKS